MKKVRTLIILFGISFLIGLFLVFRPEFWHDKIESIINKKYLTDNGWHLSIRAMEGHLFTSVILKDILVEHEEGSIFLAKSIKSTMNFFPLLTGAISLDLIKINESEMSLKSDFIKQVNQDKKINITFPKFPIRIEKFQLNGKVFITNLDSLYEANLEFTGNLSGTDTAYSLGVEQFKVNSGDSGRTIRLNRSSLTYSKQGELISHINGFVFSIPIEGKFAYINTPDKHLSGRIKLEEISLLDTIVTYFPMKHKFSSITATIDFESNLKSFRGNVGISNILGLDLEGEIFLDRNNESIFVNNLELKSDSTILKINGYFHNSGMINGKIILSNLDLNQWIVGQKNTNISGVVDINGFVKNGLITDVILKTEIQETSLFPEEFVTLTGTVSYHDSLVQIVDPLLLSIGPSSVVLEGNMNVQTESMDLSIKMNEANVFIVNKFLLNPIESGSATGNMKVLGTISKPTLNADLFCKKIVYNGISLEEMEIHFRFDNSKDITNGYTHLVFTEGKWKDYQIDNGTIDLKIDSGVIELENVQLNKENNYLQLSGKIEDDGSIVFDRFQAAYSGHYIALPSPLKFNLNNESIVVNPFILHVDDGVIEGYFHKKQYFDGRFKFSNIEASLLSPFIQNDRYQLSGMIFGELGVHQSLGKYGISSDLSVKKGSIAGQKFDDLIISLFVREDVLQIEELTLIQGEKSGFQAMGTLPLVNNLGAPVEINLDTKFSNLDLDIISHIIPNWFRLEGIISGEMNIFGNTEKTRFDFDMNIKEAVFDKIKFGFVKGRGNYDGQTLDFSQYSSEWKQNFLEGHASLPLDYNIGSNQFGRAILEKPIFLSIGGRTKDLHFISSYIDGLDSIVGNFKIQLGLSGDWNNLIRDGLIDIVNANIFTDRLKNPITNVDGRGQLLSNRLTFENLNGIMNKPLENQKEKNVFITGSMDMTNFFEPYFDIWLIGENIYFEAIQEELKGMINLDVTMKGKDDITISGKIPIVDVEMFKDFTSFSLPGSFSKDGRVSLNYKINFPITEQFILLNNQIDASLGGDISIIKNGISETDFSGELIFKKGKLYYSGDIFTITEGYLIFDKIGFNPYFDMTAYTTIDDEQIDISFTGPLENPQLILTSESGFSQSDILELLTWGKRFEDQEISYSGFGKRATSLVEGWVNTQLNRKFMQLSGLAKLGIVNNVTIEGAAGLINPGGKKDFKIEASVTKTISLNYAFRRSFSLTHPNHAVGVEYKVNKYLSLIGDVDQNGKVHAKYKLRYDY